MARQPKLHVSANRNIIVAAVIVLAVGGLVVATMLAQPATDADSKLPASIARLREQNADPGERRKAFRELMRDETVTDEQRRNAMHEMRESRREGMMKRVNEYFAAPEEDKNSVLDDHIAEFQKRMAEWEKRRAEQEGERPTDEERQAVRNLFRNRSQAERKADSESRNPDQTAQAMAYFAAIRSRMNERGISMPRGPGGRGGFGGGGGRGRGGAGGSRHP